MKIFMKGARTALILGMICWAGASWAKEARALQVVASFTVLADMVRQVGGGDVRVRSLVGPNGDPHVYEPTPQDSQALSGAALVVMSGLGLEGWMSRLITASGYRGQIAIASEGVPTRNMTERGRAIVDPHAWTCAAYGARYVENIARALAAVDPAHAGRYRANGGRYAKELRELDAWARRSVAALPPAKRKVITSHDAFGYLGATYGIEFHAPMGLSTDSEASALALAELIDQLRREGIKALFIENSNDPRMIEQIASATRAHLGGILYPEALSPPNGPASTYAKMFRYNMEALLRGMAAN